MADCLYLQDASVGMTVYQAKATDPDSGSGGAVYYNIVVSLHNIVKLHTLVNVFIVLIIQNS